MIFNFIVIHLFILVFMVRIHTCIKTQINQVPNERVEEIPQAVPLCNASLAVGLSSHPAQYPVTTWRPTLTSITKKIIPVSWYILLVIKLVFLVSGYESQQIYTIKSIFRYRLLQMSSDSLKNFYKTHI